MIHGILAAVNHSSRRAVLSRCCQRWCLAEDGDGKDIRKNDFGTGIGGGIGTGTGARGVLAESAGENCYAAPT